MTAHIFYKQMMVAAVRFELDAETEFLAIDEALRKLEREYPGKRISVGAKELESPPEAE